MPPFFDRVQLHEALQNQAIPILKALAANDNLHSRSLRRFEHDDPPPYASSTESEEFDDDFLAPPPCGELPEELKAIMEQPISEDEMKDVALRMGSIMDPVDLYRAEAKREENRVEEYRSKIFWGVEGSRRCGVFVRHNVKRRWERLGIWNPEWGFAGRNVQPNDNAYKWKWRWEQQAAGDSESADYARDAHMEQPVARALRLRQNLRRGEHAPVLPRSCLDQDATTSQAESFIISRPGNGGMNMDFTPSEIDDLETIELPSSKQPKGFWTIERDTFQIPFPGQLLAPFQPPPALPGSYLYLPPGSFPKPSRFEKTPSEEEHNVALIEEYEDSPQELEENSPEPQRDITSPPPQMPRRQRQRHLQDRVDSAQDRDQLPPLPRRSARTAGMKRPAEPLHSQAASNKKPRGRAAPKAAPPATQPIRQETERRKTRSVPARSPPKIETETRRKRGRGRPRKENGPSTHSIVTKNKAARTPALAGAGRGGAAATDTPAVPRRQGRPRKNE